MKSVGSHCSSSLLFTIMMRVMVSHFVSDSHKVTTALCLVRVSCAFAGTDRMVLPSKVLLSSLESDRYVKIFCCGDRRPQSQVFLQTALISFVQMFALGEMNVDYTDRS